MISKFFLLKLLRRRAERREREIEKSVTRLVGPDRTKEQK